jgi:hypothetical protein
LSVLDGLFDPDASDTGRAEGSTDARGREGTTPTDARGTDAGAADVIGLDTRDAATGVVPDGPAGCPAGCPGNGYCAGTECAYPSCIARLLSLPKSPSGVYLLDPDAIGGAPPFRAFCEMVLDGGGWTLLLKVDGSKTTFAHDAPLWENVATFQPESPGFDPTEAKMAGFATMPFVYLRVGMLDNGATHWLIVPVDGNSLLDLMRTGYHPTTVGRDGWERLPARGSLQYNCNREGVNVTTPQANVRIGIVANNQNDCSTCNSWIAFGAQGQTTGDHACGNVANSSTDNGNRDVNAFGYVMVR